MTFRPVSNGLYGASLDPAAVFDGSNWIIDATLAFGFGRVSDSE